MRFQNDQPVSDRGVLRLSIVATITGAVLLTCVPGSRGAQAAWINQARIAGRLLQDENYSGAIVQYQKSIAALESQPNSDPAIKADLRMGIVRALTAQKKFAAAEKLLGEIEADIISQGYRGTTLEMRYWKRQRELGEAENSSKRILQAQKQLTDIIGKKFGTGAPLYFEEAQELQNTALFAGDLKTFFDCVKQRKQSSESDNSAGTKRRFTAWKNDLLTGVRAKVSKLTADGDALQAEQLLEGITPYFENPHQKLALWSSVPPSSDTPGNHLGTKAAKTVRLLYLSLGNASTKAETIDYKSRLAPLFWDRWHRGLADVESEQLAREYLRSHQPCEKKQAQILEYTQITSMLSYMLAKRNQLMEAERLLRDPEITSPLLTKPGALNGPFQARREIAAQYAKMGRKADASRQISELISLAKKMTGIPKSERDNLITQWQANGL